MDAPDEVLLDRAFDLTSLAETRYGVYDLLVRAGAPVPQAQAFMTSVGEGMANAIQHGGGRGVVTVRRTGGSAVVAEIRDRGEAPPFELPTQAPPPDQTSGRGLWMASQLCDRVQVRSGPRGTSLILELKLAS